jgi:hypothetical protein
LIFGGIFVPAVAALITVAGIWAGRDTEAHDGGYDRPWGEGGYPYKDYPGSGEGGGHHGGGEEGGAGDGGGGF